MIRIRSTTALVLAVLLAGVCSASRADEAAEVRQLLRAGQTTEAAVKLDQFLAQKPKDPQLRFLKGVMLTERQQTAEAIEVFTALTADYPELAEPYNNLAVLYAGQGQYDKARVALEAAIRGNPGYATAYENLGDVYARLAAQAYARAQQLEPDNAALAPKSAQLRGLFTLKPVAARSAAAPASSAAKKGSP
jgi:tetratricopeptide (TPR) repeat protein